jgi:TPR repeat protein
VKWYEQAIASEHALALHHLGHMYLALQDPVWLAQFPNPKFKPTAYAITLYRRAEETFRKNIEQGDGLAAYLMAVERRDEPTFYHWLEQSRQLLEIQAMKGDAVRQYYLGRSYMFRKPKITSFSGFVSDPVKAFAWFTVAARNGNLHANVYQIEAAELMRIRDHAQAEKATRELLNRLNAPHD